MSESAPGGGDVFEGADDFAGGEGGEFDVDFDDGLVRDTGDDGPLPVVAIVGRPNVGKSTLVNRVLGRREAVVQDVPGVTRDRVAYDATWRGRRFTVLDTGGWQPDARDLAASVAAQAEIAVAASDATVLVVDATTGPTETDRSLARVLQRGGKPVLLAANKVDDERAESDATEFWSLGLGEPFAVSALHGRGSGDLLDKVLDLLPAAPVDHVRELAGPRRVALIGRPNVGKSSLLNQLSGEERAVVDAVAGTTRDPVDSIISLGGKTWRFVDTAGIKRRARDAQGADFYSVLRTERALESAEVAIVLVDGSESLSEQDTRVISMVADAGRALVLAINKWDLVDEDRRYELERELERDLVQVQWAPRVNISARTGRAVEKLAPALERSLASWEQRIPTGRLNTWLNDVIAATPPPVRGGKQPKVLFATQAASRPPRFVLFSSGFLEASYRRFLERRLREAFGFEGTPIEISVRVREKGQRGKR
jgi:GTP-binding protein